MARLNTLKCIEDSIQSILNVENKLSSLEKEFDNFTFNYLDEEENKISFEFDNENFIYDLILNKILDSKGNDIIDLENLEEEFEEGDEEE